MRKHPTGRQRKKLRGDPSERYIFSYFIMLRHVVFFHVSRFYSRASSRSKSIWDPTLSLDLKHPTLVLLEKCETTEHFKQILSQFFRLHLVAQTFPMSRLLYFCAISHPQLLNNALLLFNHFTPNPNLFIFNTMISALSSSFARSVALYKSMLQGGVFPDEHTILPLLKSSLKNLILGKQLHAHVIAFGFSLHAYLQNSLVKMYLENGEVYMAEILMQFIDEKDAALFNTLMSWFAKRGQCLDALKVFDEMLASGIEPDQYSVVSLLVCCGQWMEVLLGKSVHGWMEKKMVCCNWGLVLSNALLDMYAKCGDMNSALRVFYRANEKDRVSWNIMIAGFSIIGEFDMACKFFAEMPDRDLVTWNSLLTGYAQKGEYRRVMELFSYMLSQNIETDNVTAITLVSAAADMGVLNQGKGVHGWVIKRYGILDAFFRSALIDMYCKCGSIEKAGAVFEMVSKRDLTIWTAMITGLALHGHGTKALELFSHMQDEGLLPNNVTLLAVLAACSHSGLVDQGVEIFETMKQVFSINPGVEHYGCLVDILARSGRLNEAMNAIKVMPTKPSPSIWGSILSASKACGNLEVAEAALKELMKLEPEEEGGYVLLSNAYAAWGRWSHSGKIREIMDRKGVKKMAGYSSVDVDGIVHSFLSSDNRHPRWSDVHILLSDLHKEMSSGEERYLMHLHQS